MFKFIHDKITGQEACLHTSVFPICKTGVTILSDSMRLIPPQKYLQNSVWYVVDLTKYYLLQVLLLLHNKHFKIIPLSSSFENEDL